jgi:uncharacterized protein (DUF433 family)
LDAGPVQPVLLRRAGSHVRAIDQSDLFYLYAVRALKDELTPKARGAFHEALIRQWDNHDGEVRFGRFRVAISDLLEEVEQRTLHLADLSKKIEFRSDGEALLKGPNIEAHRIAALLDGGMTIDAILYDYPSLSREQIIAAMAYGAAHPKSGRPYPPVTAKQALRSSGLDALDDVLDTDSDSESE